MRMYIMFVQWMEGCIETSLSLSLIYTHIHQDAVSKRTETLIKRGKAARGKYIIEQ